MAVTVQQEVAALYSAIFNRAPDQAGLQFWVDAIEGGDTLVQAAEGFTLHPVFAETYAGMSNSEFVQQLYVNVLGGAGDANGIQFWTDKLDSGVSMGQVVAEFVQGALSIDLDALLASGELSQDEYDAAVVRQDSLTNKADVGLSFVAKFGAASNLSADTDTTTKEGLESDPVYLASQAAIAKVTADPASVTAANAAIEAAQSPVELNESPSFTLAEALAAQQAGELPEEYQLSDGDLALEEAVNVADAQAALEAAQAVIDGAVNEVPVALNATYTLLDSADAIIAAAGSAVVTGAVSVTVDNESLTREQYDALSQLDNVDLEGVAVDNTAPEAVEAAAEVAEDATFAGQLEAADPDVADQGDALTFALAEGQEAVAGFTLNADGSYSFDAAQEAFQALQAGDTQDVVINYTVTDSKGATSTSTLTLTVTGTDDAPVVAIAEGTENALLTDTVFGAEDSISDVDGFGEGATVTLAYAEAVSAAGQYGKPSFQPDDAEFRVARDGNTFTLIAEGGENGFEADTAIGTVTPVGLKEVLDANGQGTGNYTQTGYTLELNDNVSPAVLTALLKQLSVQGAADGSNTQLTVTIASQGGAESVEFVRNINGDDAGSIVLNDGAELAALEAELTAGALGDIGADVPFAPFGQDVLTTAADALIDGMTVTMASDNADDVFNFGDADNGFEVVNGQLIYNSIVVADVAGLDTNKVVISFRDDVALTATEVNDLLNNLELDMVDEVSERSVSLNVTSADGLASDSLSRDISVLGKFTEVTLADIKNADAESVVTINGNTILNVAGFTGVLDVEAQREAGNLIIEGANPIRVIVGTDANLSEVEGLELLGDLRIQSVANGSTLTLNATQVDFLSTAGEVAGEIHVLALEDNLDADLSVLEAAGGLSAEISAAAGNVTFTGNFGTAEVSVGLDSTLTATAAVLSEVTVTGNVVVTGLDGAAAYDLAGLEAATAVLATGVTTLNEETVLGTVEITVPQNSELVLTAAQANGTTIDGGDVNGTGNKGGSVTVLGLVDSVDLSNITVSTVLAGAVNATQSDLIVTFRAEDEEAVDADAHTDGVISNVNLGNFSVQVEAGATLRIDEHANGAIITGAGNVEVHVDTAGALDLSEITVEGDKLVKVTADVDFASVNLGQGEAIDFGDFAVNVAANATLTLSSSQADQLTVTGESVEVADIQGFGILTADQGGSVVIELDGDAAYDFSGITAGAESAEEANDAGTVTATVATTTVLNAETKLGAITRITIDTTEGADLTLSAAQASGLTVTGTDNVALENTVVTVNDLAADTDLSGIVTGDTGIDEVIANVSGAVDISANANLDSVTEFRVANDATLTLSARQADAQVVNVAAAVAADVDNEVEAQAAGAVVVAGPVEAIEEGDNALDFTNLPDVITFAGGELVIGEGVTLTLSAAQANGKVITGAGNVVVQELGTDAVDLSGITVTGDKNLVVSQDLALNAATKLGDFAVEVTAEDTLTLTAAQATALVTLTGAGAVVINGTNGADDLDFSAKGWDVAELTINGAGSGDVLIAPAGFEGKVTLNGGTNADRFEVASGEVIIGDFQAGVDELLVTEGATAVMTLSADTDLSTLQAAELIDIQGTLRIDLNGFKLTATAGQLENIEVEDTLANLLTMAKDATIAGKVALTASAVIASDIGEDGEAVMFDNVEADQSATTIDFVDNEATLTFAQLGQITAELGANLSLTGADAITVTGVANGTDLVAADAELNDESDTIEVNDGATITLTPAELNALSAIIAAAADGVGTDATVSVTLANTDAVTRATDLVDTFDVSALTNNDSASITGLGVNDVIATGLVFAVEGASQLNGVLSWSFDDQNDTLTYELSDDNAIVETVTVTLTGVASVTQADGSFTVQTLDGV